MLKKREEFLTAPKYLIQHLVKAVREGHKTPNEAMAELRTATAESDLYVATGECNMNFPARRNGCENGNRFSKKNGIYFSPAINQR